MPLVIELSPNRIVDGISVDGDSVVDNVVAKYGACPGGRCNTFTHYLPTPAGYPTPEGTPPAQIPYSHELRYSRPDRSFFFYGSEPSNSASQRIFSVEVRDVAPYYDTNISGRSYKVNVGDKIGDALCAMEEKAPSCSVTTAVKWRKSNGNWWAEFPEGISFMTNVSGSDTPPPSSNYHNGSVRITRIMVSGPGHR